MIVIVSVLLKQDDDFYSSSSNLGNVNMSARKSYFMLGLASKNVA